MRVLVTGDRNWDDYYIVDVVLAGFRDLAHNTFDEEFVVIEGGAKGADQCAREWGVNNDFVRHITEDANWRRYGKRAGPIRNRKMVDEHEPDFVVAFHDNLDESKGTKDCVDYAKFKGLYVYHIRHL